MDLDKILMQLGRFAERLQHIEKNVSIKKILNLLTTLLKHKFTSKKKEQKNQI